MGPIRTAHEARNRVEPTDHLCIHRNLVSASCYQRRKTNQECWGYACARIETLLGRGLCRRKRIRRILPLEIREREYHLSSHRTGVERMGQGS